MKNNLFYAFVAFTFIGLMATANVQAQEKEPTRDQFVSDASHIVGTYKPGSVDHSVAAIEASANALLDAFNKEQKAKVTHALDSAERYEWTNLPARPNAGGVRLGDMNEKQVTLVCDLMANVFSQQGYDKMVQIMLADDQLLRNGRARPGFGTENFSVVIFGTPSKTEPWCFQLDGHHVGVNVSIEGEKMTMSPSFIGTQPQGFKIGETQYRPFKNETDLAHELAISLTDDQVKEAVLKPNRQRILTGPGNDGKVPPAKGVDCSTFSKEQKAVLINLISQWVNDLPEAQASKRMKEIESELDQMKFAWNGNREPGSDVSYTIQSPSLIIEYACQDLGGNPLDHLHSMYRNPTKEYGSQLGQ